MVLLVTVQVMVNHISISLLPAYEDKSLKLMRKGKDWTIMITRTTHIMFTCVYEDPKKRGLLTLYLTPFPEGLNVQPHVAWKVCNELLQNEVVRGGGLPEYVVYFRTTSSFARNLRDMNWHVWMLMITHWLFILECRWFPEWWRWYCRLLTWWISNKRLFSCARVLALSRLYIVMIKIIIVFITWLSWPRSYWPWLPGGGKTWFQLHIFNSLIKDYS